ncbi:hypothetical protein C2845_PM01G45840 [Panicum miliaceum]|uniref:Uncharacterized protein n=1 Tax=Panicum miliaceum TaxID=4540 RepID=A0A3L6TIQ1_PANMI|nr:hypothetical protein C2845_PM01G45840 [Panicum miliaceum]
MIADRSPIDITTLVTRIAANVKALDNAQVTYLPWEEDYQPKVGVEHFVQGHMMCEVLGNSLLITYPGYDREVELPCLRLSLYSVKSLLLQKQKTEPAHHSVASPATRRQTRSSTQQQEQAGPSQQAGTSNMSFEEAYEHYTQGGWSVELSTLRVQKPNRAWDLRSHV